jgi:hypothetical protein
MMDLQHPTVYQLMRLLRALSIIFIFIGTCENSSPLVLIVPVPFNTKFDDDPTVAID